MKTINVKCRTVSDTTVHSDLICGAIIAGIVLIWLGRVL